MNCDEGKPSLTLKCRIGLSIVLILAYCFLAVSTALAIDLARLIEKEPPENLKNISGFSGIPGEAILKVYTDLPELSFECNNLIHLANPSKGLYRFCMAPGEHTLTVKSERCTPLEKRFLIDEKELKIIFISSVENEQIQKVSSLGETSLPRSLLYNRILVNTVDQNSVRGFLVDFKDDSLSILSDGELTAIPAIRLKSLKLNTERNKTRSTVYALFISVYLGNLLFGTANGHPTAYLADEKGWLNVAFCVGSIFGYRYGASPVGSEQNFKFSDNSSKKRSSIDKFYRYVHGLPRQNNFHIQIQTGEVNSRNYHDFKNALTQAGYNTGIFWSPLGGDIESHVSNFNLLRKLQITCPVVLDGFEAGVAVIWAGEPTIVGKKGGSEYVRQEQNTIGYFAVGKYRINGEATPGEIIWDVGVGMGLVKVDFSLDATRGSSGDYLFERTLDEDHIGGTIFTSIDYYIYHGLSFGLAWDSVILPVRNVDGIPELDIPEQKLDLGNTCFGVTLGFHF